MRKIYTAVLFSLFFSVISANAQSNQQVTNRVDKLSIGPGLGQDYGGIGINAVFYPIKEIGVFAGAGYALADVGYNVGAKFRWVTMRKVDPYFVAMYGYNAAFVIKGADNFNKLFYGPTVGAGMDFRSSKLMKTGYWSLAILMPIRSAEVDQYTTFLKNNNGIKFNSELLPVDISIGYHFIII